MPPKKKGKAKGKKGKKKKTSDDNGLQEKYKRSTLDVAVLKQHLALRRDVVRQAQACSHNLKSRLAVLEQELDEEREDKKDINADLTRQYKTMQMETGLCASRTCSASERRSSAQCRRRTPPSQSCRARSTTWRQTMRGSCMTLLTASCPAWLSPNCAGWMRAPHCTLTTRRGWQTLGSTRWTSDPSLTSAWAPGSQVTWGRQHNTCNP
ncbi:coiled-coil domain-containing protein 153 isoform X1 [Polyodon spathula]|uniref:coiled-coil domain-containing protein 153 isoform X1 n=1 Tax=Polyodon spathula TaxID=7913 RepID=UPI001B7E1275|nr:coiled-coil domain-containing protein 153 isoform X1 [Polyodon spathula]XP_041090721.1 coiled-coil domain-containing protein 153 isoform X1 [Polyodon spathula]